MAIGEYGILCRSREAHVIVPERSLSIGNHNEISKGITFLVVSFMMMLEAMQ